VKLSAPGKESGGRWKSWRGESGAALSELRGKGEGDRLQCDESVGSCTARQKGEEGVIRTLKPVLTQLKSEIRSSEVAAASWRVST
jgi:hypothetical protein